MSELDWFVGVDWGSASHQACVIDEDGEVRGNRAFAHSGPGLSALAAWIAETVGGAPPETVGVAIETPHGPVAESLLAHGLAVHAINPKQLVRILRPWREARCGPGGPRTPGRRTRRSTGEVARTSSSASRPWREALWKRAPTPAAARGMRASNAKLLKKHRIRRFGADTLKSRLAEPAPARRSAGAHALLAGRLAVVAEPPDRRIDGTRRRRPGARDRPPRRGRPQRDAAILLSIPGVGRIVLALFAEADDAPPTRLRAALPRRRGAGHHAVRKAPRVTRRLAVHGPAARRLRPLGQHGGPERSGERSPLPRPARRRTRGGARTSPQHAQA